MGKSIIKKLAVLALVLTLATTSLVAGTFAKYTTSVTGTDSARVAKFDVSATLIGVGSSSTFDLFAATVDSDGISAEKDVDIDGSGTERVIAPGTKGSFDIVLTNSSEVTVQYAIAFTSILAGVPLEFSTDGGSNWTPTLADISETTLAIGDASVTKTVQWRWVYSVDADGDIADTILGLAGTAAPSVTATVTFTQVD